MRLSNKIQERFTPFPMNGTSPASQAGIQRSSALTAKLDAELRWLLLNGLLLSYLFAVVIDYLLKPLDRLQISSYQKLSARKSSACSRSFSKKETLSQIRTHCIDYADSDYRSHSDSPLHRLTATLQ